MGGYWREGCEDPPCEEEGYAMRRVRGCARKEGCGEDGRCVRLRKTLMAGGTLR